MQIAMEESLNTTEYFEGKHVVRRSPAWSLEETLNKTNNFWNDFLLEKSNKSLAPFYGRETDSNRHSLIFLGNDENIQMRALLDPAENFITIEQTAIPYLLITFKYISSQHLYEIENVGIVKVWLGWLGNKINHFAMSDFEQEIEERKLAEMEEQQKEEQNFLRWCEQHQIYQQVQQEIEAEFQSQHQTFLEKLFEDEFEDRVFPFWKIPHKKIFYASVFFVVRLSTTIQHHFYPPPPLPLEEDYFSTYSMSEKSEPKP